MEVVSKAGRCSSKRVGALIGKGCECHIDKSESGHGGNAPAGGGMAGYHGEHLMEDYANEMRRGLYVDERTIEVIEEQIGNNLYKMRRDDCKALTRAQQNRCCSGKTKKSKYYIRVGPPDPDPSSDTFRVQPDLPFGG